MKIEKKLSRMLWWRRAASISGIPLLLALPAYLWVSHANLQLLSLEGVILMLEADLLATMATLRAAADTPPADFRGILRVGAIASFLAGLLVFYYALMGHLPPLG